MLAFINGRASKEISFGVFLGEQACVDHSTVIPVNSFEARFVTVTLLLNLMRTKPDVTLQVKDEACGGIFVDHTKLFVDDRAVFQLVAIPQIVSQCVIACIYLPLQSPDASSSSELSSTLMKVRESHC